MSYSAKITKNKRGNRYAAKIFYHHADGGMDCIHSTSYVYRSEGGAIRSAKKWLSDNGVAVNESSRQKVAGKNGRKGSHPAIQEIRRILGSDSAGSNPLVSTKKRARKLYQEFHAEPIDKVIRLNVSMPDMSGAVVIGQIDRVRYDAKSKRVGYREHRFWPDDPKKRPLLCASGDGRWLFVVPGDFEFTKNGIIDKKMS